MTITQRKDITICYDDRQITLTGDTQQIAAEADKIMRRFAGSAQPWLVQRHEQTRIVLAPRRLA